MSARPAPPAAPLLGLVAELRAQVQLRAETAGPLAASHALLLAWLTLLLALLARSPPTPLETTAPIPEWERPGVHGLLPTGEQRALARILYVIGPGPCLGMRPHPAARPAPELRPPIPRPRAHPRAVPPVPPPRGRGRPRTPIRIPPCAPPPNPVNSLHAQPRHIARLAILVPLVLHTGGLGLRTQRQHPSRHPWRLSRFHPPTPHHPRQGKAAPPSRSTRTCPTISTS
jgi:hypothetical protein